MDKKERFNEAFNYLKSKGLAHMQRDVAEKMGATPQNVSLALRGAPAVLTDRFLMRFNNAYFGMFNLDWLLTGVGDMLSPTGKLTALSVICRPPVITTAFRFSILNLPAVASSLASEKRSHRTI